MAYEQRFKMEDMHRQHNDPSRDYTPSQPYDPHSLGYNERPPNAHRFRGPTPNQRPYNNGYTQDRYGANGGREFQFDGGGYGNGVRRSPQAQFAAGGYERPMKRLPMQPPQPRPINTRHEGYQVAPAPRSAGPYPDSSGNYVHDQPHAPRQFLGGRGPQEDSGYPRNGGNAEASGYSGYNRSETHYDPSYDGQDDGAFRPQNAQLNQYHRRGHSDGYGQRIEPHPQSARRHPAQDRPIHEHREAPSRRGQGMQKRTVFNDQISPETVSWDNPFPTFPGAKKKSAQAEGSLDGSMADVSLMSGSEKSGDTASNRSNAEVSKTMDGPRSNKGHFPTDVDTQFRQNGETHGHGHQRQGKSDIDRSGYRNQTQLQQHENGRPPVGSIQEDRRFHPDHTRLDYPNGRRWDGPARGPPMQNHTLLESESGRSRTMPSTVSNAVMVAQSQKEYRQQSAWHESDHDANGSGADSRGYQLVRPQTASVTRPAGPGKTRSGEIARFRSDQSNLALGSLKPAPQQTLVQPPALRQDSIADLYDSYYEASPFSQPHNVQPGERKDRQSIEDDMPNFDALPLASPGHQRGMTIDDHISPRLQSSEMPPMPVQYRQGDPARSHARQVMHSKSQPNMKNRRPPKTQQDSGFDFGIPEPYAQVSYDEYRTNQGHVQPPPERHGYDRQHGLSSATQLRPSIPYHSNEGAQRDEMFSQANDGARPYNLPSHQHPNQGPSERYRSRPEAGAGESYARGIRDEAQYERYRSPTGKESAPSNRQGIGPASPPQATNVKPDALPAHPAPVRPGLMQRSSPNQPAKPVPVRNYNNNSSLLPQANQELPPGPIPQPTTQPVPPTITANELEKSRQAAKSNPTDQKAQMILAKNLVSAAIALEGYVTQTDQKARNKTREKYVAEAHKIIKKSISAGHPDAMFFLGDCYSQGRLGLEKDTKEAFALYQNAAKAGHAQAAFRVAVCCELGLEEDGGTKRDIGKAVQWYKRAATLGDTPAMYKTGVIQLKGLLGQPKDPVEAVVWLRKAAEKADKDNPHALHELALWHEAASGSGKSAGDEAYAKQLFVQAAELGYKFSQFRLGRACEYGLMGCPIDPRLSISWYSKAAVQEEHQSELALSGWYLTGAEGVLQQSDTEAYLWARKAATAGLAKAEFAMGYFTEVGIGCPPSSEEAKRWYWRAAAQNFPKARERLEELRRGGAKMKKERVSRSAMKQESECSIM